MAFPSLRPYTSNLILGLQDLQATACLCNHSSFCLFTNVPGPLSSFLFPEHAKLILDPWLLLSLFTLLRKLSVPRFPQTCLLSFSYQLKCSLLGEDFSDTSIQSNLLQRRYLHHSTLFYFLLLSGMMHIYVFTCFCLSFPQE